MPGNFLAELPIPVPSVKFQQRLVEDLLSAKTSHDADIARVERLRSTLDRYVLRQLQIDGPTNDRSVFAVSRAQIHQRLDVHYSSPRFDLLRRAIDAAPYRTPTLGELCTSFRTGFAAGATRQARGSVGSIPHLRPLNFSALGEITLADTKMVPGTTS